MKRISFLPCLALAAVLFSSAQVFGTDIYRLLDPVYGGRYGKSPEAGPPFLRFGSIQQYYHIADAQYNNHSTAVGNVFSSWNSAGSVQFSSSQSSGLTLDTFWDDYGKTIYPYIVNPGVSYTSHSNYIINTSNSYVELNTFHDWFHDGTHNLQNDDFDVETILVHEVGHIHGLAHNLTDSYTHDATAPIMAGGDNEYFWNHTARSLRTDDVNGTAFLQYNTWVPDQCATIQTALNNSFSGVTIHVTGSQTISSNTTIPSGITLAVNSGVTLTFGTNIKLSVSGTLSSSGATFQGNGSPGSWNSISFYANSSGSVQYSTITDAQCGIYANGANVNCPNNTVTNNSLYGLSIIQGSDITITNCTISNNGTGINLSGSTAAISGNSIYNNSNYGIHAENVNCSENWESNTLEGNSGYSIFLNNTSPIFFNNLITGNGHGVVISSASPFWGLPSVKGYNTITCATTPLFRAENSSDVFMGYYEGAGGYNSVFGSDLP
ncbi:MAG TPA: right-handed parallel beta-helix repeat-containing protein, partial [Ignavibacteriaceae bacterium]|nr:right-handed parallel beta-helix repeat-containing protein [Ignavibacteriaceae bacterium]